MDETSLQRQARALGDPTRHSIFRCIVDAGRPVSVAELTAQFRFNHNAIRQHLAKLVAAGLVQGTTSPATGRGRPRLLYEADPAFAGQWGTPGPYERLSRLLVEVIRTGQRPEEVGRQAADGFRSPAPSGDAVADVADAMARQGFDPEVRRKGGAHELVLHHCPFETSALADRETVCALHLGIAEGLADGTSVVVTDLVAYDPRSAGCRLRLRHAGDPPGDPADERATLTLRGRSR